MPQLTRHQARHSVEHTSNSLHIHNWWPQQTCYEVFQFHTHKITVKQFACLLLAPYASFWGSCLYFKYAVHRFNPSHNRRRSHLQDSIGGGGGGVVVGGGAAVDALGLLLLHYHLQSGPDLISSTTLSIQMRRLACSTSRPQFCVPDCRQHAVECNPHSALFWSRAKPNLAHIHIKMTQSTQHPLSSA